LQERQGEIDAAEETLLSARRRQPGSTEPYKHLVQFYGRRVAALQPVTVKEAFADSAKAGVPDDKGVYQVGGGVQAPTKVDPARPQYPSEAKLAGVQGTVIVEIVVDQNGAVSDAKVVRSIPLLDDEALRAVRNWHFAQAVVNGQPAAVRMNVAVSFKPDQ
jgi:TonB family protein